MAARSLVAALRRGGGVGGSARLFSTTTSAGAAAASGEPVTSVAASEAPELADGDSLRDRIFRLGVSKRSATAALERWVSESQLPPPVTELRAIARELRRFGRYKHALEISEWMKTHHNAGMSGSDYGLRIELISKVFGTNAAEDFFQNLPPSARSYEAYSALLHSYGRSKMIENAERLFDEMKNANMCLDVLVYNEMMSLYISVGQLEKVTGVVEELKQRNVKPDLFTYNSWISASAASLDVKCVRRILDEMSMDPSSEDGWTTYRILAEIYVSAGHLVGSANSIVQADAKVTQREWITYDFLVILHAGLGNIGRIRQIWKSMQMTLARMTSRNYICILSSYLMLGQMKDAGEVIDQWKQSKDPEFDISACNRLSDAFVQTGLMDISDSFRGLMLQKDCQLGIQKAEAHQGNK